MDSRMAKKDLKFHQRLYKSGRKAAKESLNSIGDFLIRQSPIPAQAVMDPSDFCWAAMLEENFPVIQRELDRVMQFRESLPQLHEVQREQYRVSSDINWKVFVLSGWGHVSEVGERMCPETARIVREIPGVRSALFSILEAGAQIPDHRGHIKGLLRGHLAMRVPKEREKCFLRVDDKICHWEQGKLLVFDDTYRHEVQNNTDEERIVLLLHFDRPMNRLGRLTNALLLSVIRKTPFVKKAIRNHNQWEDQFRRQLAAAGAQIS
jgi:aspartyl/asparaginyl beta-hydroxylase (cupin superfamily)